MGMKRETAAPSAWTGNLHSMAMVTSDFGEFRMPTAQAIQPAASNAVMALSPHSVFVWRAGVCRSLLDFLQARRRSPDMNMRAGRHAEDAAAKSHEGNSVGF